MNWKLFGPSLAILLVVLIGVGARFLPDLTSETAGGEAAIGGPFTLVDQDGKTVTEQDFAGKYMLVYFGFTYCPDVCPSGLATNGQAMDLMDDRVDDMVVPIFITIDPERDTPEAMGAYVQHFYPTMIGLTGTEEQVAAVAKEYRVYYARVEQETAADYTMDHSSITYLMGPDGSFLTHYSHGTTAPAIAESMSKYLDLPYTGPTG